MKEGRERCTTDVDGSFQSKKNRLSKKDLLGGDTELVDFRFSQLDAFPSIIPSFQQPLYQPFQSLHPNPSLLPPFIYQHSLSLSLLSVISLAS